MKNAIRLLSACILLIGLGFAVCGQERPDPLVAVLNCPDRVHAVAFSPDDRLLAAGIGWNEKGGARIWSLPARKVVADITSGSGQDANVEAIAFSPDGRLFAMADWGGNVTLWNTSDWRMVKTVAKGRNDPKSLSFSSDGAKLLVAGEKSVVLADIESSLTETIENETGRRYIEARFSNIENQIIVSDDESTRILDLKTKRPVRTWKAENFFFGKMSENNRYLVTGGGAIYGPKLLKIIDLRADKTIAKLDEFRDGIYGLAFSADKDTFAVSGGGYGSGGYVSVWDTLAGKELGYVSYGDMPIQGLAYSHDDKLLAGGSENGAVVLYDPSKLRGPEVKKQEYQLCGEVVREEGKTYIVPITKLPSPSPAGDELDFRWKLEIANGEAIKQKTATIILNSWALESSSGRDRVRVANGSAVNTLDDRNESIVFAQIQNPGWNLGFIAKLYSNGSYVVTDNPGKCLAVGRLDKLGTTFTAVKKRLTEEGVLALAQKPLAPRAAHFSTRFIAIESGGATQIRSDAVDFQIGAKTTPSSKYDAFDLIYRREEPFLRELVRLSSLSQITRASPK